MKPAEPRLVYDPREYEAGYVSALEMSGGYSARLDFSFFGALTELPDHATIPVGDITFEGSPVVIEVKTKGDLASSMASGRLEWAVWNMYLLKQSGVVDGFAILVRGISEPLHENAKASYLIARRALAKWSVRFGFTVLLAEDPSDVVEIAKSFMREYTAPKDATMPPPIIPAWAMQWPFAVRVYAMVEGLLDDVTGKRGPGIGPELSVRIAETVSFKGITRDAHDMDEDGFCDAWKHKHGFGGRENVRLRALYRALSDDSLYVKPPENENVFYIKPREELIKP